MIDSLAEVVTMLQPGAPFSKLVGGAGAWRVSRTEPGRTSCCVILEGACLLPANEDEPTVLQEGDFILIPSVHGFSMSSLEPPPEQIVT